MFGVGKCLEFIKVIKGEMKRVGYWKGIIDLGKL